MAVHEAELGQALTGLDALETFEEPRAPRVRRLWGAAWP